MILLIDNYDSFTYNLLQYLGEVSTPNTIIKVVRNDAISVADVKKLSPSHIIISPGPCSPAESGICVGLVKELAPSTPILGVCLGHQCIAAAFGGRIVRAERQMHGKTSKIYHDAKGVFKELENPFIATRYHSLLVDEDSLPNSLEISARTKDTISKDTPIQARSTIMALRHKKYKRVIGVQFHPESILTSSGKKILSQFLQLTAE